jgi:hypothetical protein
MTRLWLVTPLGILFAWSGAWTCSTYTLSDGGTSSFNQTPPNNGSGTQGPEDSGVIVVYAPDAGNQFGLMPGPDGGVTVGPAASFSSNFVYMSNSGDGTISRILIPSSGSPYEQARYYSVVPVDNHNVEPMKGAKDIWQAAGQDQLNGLSTGVLGCSAYSGGMNSPSRTIVDRSGNCWVALRTNSYQCSTGNIQAGVTEIVNVGDNLSECTPRCVNRKGIFGTSVPFTEGIPLPTSATTTVTLSPPGIIAPNSAYAKAYPCLDPGGDPTGTVERVATNYDDCLKMSIPLGDPNPDPNADPDGLTRGISYGRAAAMGPNCNPTTEQCDVWVGMWNGTSMVHLGYSSPYTGGAPYDVVKVINTGVNPYGATVDCAGIVWSGAVGVGNLAAVTTIPLNDPATGLNIPADTLISPFGGIQNSSSCAQYGISSDVKERIWLASWTSGSKACSFNAGALLADYAGYTGGTITPAAMAADMQAAWSTYDLGGQASPCGGNGRGINTDKNNNVYMAYDCGASSAIAFNPDILGTVGCNSPNSGGAACPKGSFTWAAEAHNGGNDESIGIDLDADGNIWVGNYNSASAVQFNGTTGAYMNRVSLGNNVYSYSDFSGYALRNITLSSGLLSQVFNGCGTSPEFTQWQTLSYTVSTPTGTDVEIEVQPTNSLDPATLANETPITVCQSVVNGNCAGSPQVCTPCGDPINLEQFNLPGSQYLVVDVLLFPKICSQNGGATATDKPVLYGLNITEFCPGN